MTFLNYRSVICPNTNSPTNPISGVLILYQYNDNDFVIHTTDKTDHFVDYLKQTNAKGSKNEIRVLYTESGNFKFLCLAAIDETVESVRVAVMKGIAALKSYGANDIKLEVCHMAKEVAIGATLSQYKYNLLKKKDDKDENDCDIIRIRQIRDCEEYDKGYTIAYHQNMVRFLADTPANLMTPCCFVDYAKDFLKGKPVKITVFDKKEIEEKNMNLFLSVSAGSSQPMKLLQISYKGRDCNKIDLALVGKGITFDSGGYSLKTPSHMLPMKADMTGGAIVLSLMSFLCESKTKLNVNATIPLCENLINGCATKPGDVIIGMKGKSVEIDNTDAEGRLILADALCLAGEDKPEYTIDIATLTGAIRVSLGIHYIGLFSNDDKLGELIAKAGNTIGDNVWRMPLDKKFLKGMKSDVADLKNISKEGGGSCSAAAFLNEFVDGKYAHLDIAGVMDSYSGFEFGKGLSGRGFMVLSEVVNELAKEIN